MVNIDAYVQHGEPIDIPLVVDCRQVAAVYALSPLNLAHGFIPDVYRDRLSSVESGVIDHLLIVPPLLFVAARLMERLLQDGEASLPLLYDSALDGNSPAGGATGADDD